jgi:hypothetical protein
MFTTLALTLRACKAQSIFNLVVLVGPQSVELLLLLERHLHFLILSFVVQAIPTFLKQLQHEVAPCFNFSIRSKGRWSVSRSHHSHVAGHAVLVQF